jgi:hypothetical protein
MIRIPQFLQDYLSTSYSSPCRMNGANVEKQGNKSREVGRGVIDRVHRLTSPQSSFLIYPFGIPQQQPANTPPLSLTAHSPLIPPQRQRLSLTNGLRLQPPNFLTNQQTKQLFSGKGKQEHTFVLPSHQPA